MVRHRLDVRGTYCPVPLLMTGRHAQQLQSGDRLQVVGDDPTMSEDIPKWCEQAGHRLLQLECQGRLVSCWIEIDGGSSAATARG